MTLPAFLLAAADSKIVWLGCKRLVVPAVNTRWSPARVLALVAAQIALAILLGGVISLLVAGQPWNWLMQLFGVFAASQGIVVAGLMALCWNQRVTGMRENPGLAIGLPPARSRLGRWALGLVYSVVLAGVTPLAMLVTVENVYGQMAWRREQARLVAQGERLTFREILGPEIPAAQNAGAAPIFAPLFDPRGGDDKPSAEVTNAIARFKQAVFVPTHYLPEKPAGSHRPPKRPENMAAWSAAYRKMVASPTLDDPAWVKQLRLPAPGDPARDVLAGLAMGDAVVAEICAAAVRTRAQFPVHWDQGFGLLLQHLANLKQVQINLQLRCAAHLAAGETDAAFTVATNAFNVAELLREEPLLISQLVRFASGAIAVNTLWQGLATHQWTDAQLAVFQERLGRLDYLAGLILGFEGERACGIVGLEDLISHPPPLPLREGGVSFHRVAILIPYGMLRQNQAALARYNTDILGELRTHLTFATQSGLVPVIKTRAERQCSKFERMPYSPFNFLVKQFAPATASAETKAAKLQTMAHLAITACALERHRLAHGSYPEKLEALAPALLPKPFLDPMNGQPFHYHRTDDGWFLLYSVGEDGQDDGGVFRAKPKDTIKDWPWPVPTRAEAGSLF